MSEITLLDGKKVANEMKDDLRRSIKKLPRKPRLSILTIGDSIDNQIMIDSKVDICKEVGIDVSIVRLPDNISESSLTYEIEHLNSDSKVDGYIIQTPLPSNISKNIFKKVDPSKDVEGYHAENIGKMTLNQPTILPATPYAIMQLLRYYNIDLDGKSCVVIGRSKLVGLPISIMMGHDNLCTVTSCHINTPNLKDYTRLADIIITSVNIPNFITQDMIKEDAVVVDAGMTRVKDGNSPTGYRIVGDVNFEEVSMKSSYIAPVPGGVGPMTTISLLKNVIHITKLKMIKEYENNQII